MSTAYLKSVTSRIIINRVLTFNLMSLDWLHIRKCTIPDLQDIFKSICFIRLKIESSKESITSEYVKVKKNLLIKSTKEMKHSLRMNPRYQFLSEENREFVFKGLEGEEELFFHLDSFIIDLKREIEFTLKFVAKANNIKLKNFSLENITDQLSPEYKDEKSNFVKFLIDKHPQYVSFLFKELPWLKQLNAKRKTLIHDGILNRTDDYRVLFYWPPNSDEKTEPVIAMPEISIFGHSVSDWITYQVTKIDVFLKESFKIIDHCLDFQSTFGKVL